MVKTVSTTATIAQDQPDQCPGGPKRVAGGVMNQDFTLTQPLGARVGDVVEAQHVERRSAGHTDQAAHFMQHERRDRHDQIDDAVDHLVGDRDIAQHG